MDDAACELILGKKNRNTGVYGSPNWELSLKLCYLVHKSPPLIRILIFWDTWPRSRPSFYKIHFNNIFKTSSVFSSCFRIKTLYVFLSFPCKFYLQLIVYFSIVYYFINLMIFDDDYAYILQSYSCRFLHILVTKQEVKLVRRKREAVHHESQSEQRWRIII
jgi:hypothetical protein